MDKDGNIALHILDVKKDPKLPASARILTCVDLHNPLQPYIVILDETLSVLTITTCEPIPQEALLGDFIDAENLGITAAGKIKKYDE